MDCAVAGWQNPLASQEKAKRESTHRDQAGDKAEGRAAHAGPHHFRSSPAQRAQAVRRDGSAALDLAFVACGRFEAFWELDLHAWDVAAGALLVREAGGMMSALDGTPFHVGDGSTLASNGRVHDEMVAALSA